MTKDKKGTMKGSPVSLKEPKEKKVEAPPELTALEKIYRCAIKNVGVCAGADWVEVMGWAKEEIDKCPKS